VMALQHAHTLAAANVPQAQGAVIAATNQPAAVGAEGDRPNLKRMPR
jgi:hypothetical protein